MKAWAATLLLTGCGAVPVWPGQMTAPLWSLQGPARVEVTVDGQDPVLFEVDPKVTGARVAMGWARRQGLKLVGDPARGGRMARIARLEFGDSVVLGLNVELVPGDVLTHAHGRPVVGVLGDALAVVGEVRVDRGAGYVTVGTDPPEATPLDRFGPHGCGPELQRCVRGHVAEVAPGRIVLSFDRPDQVLPKRLWARVDFGRPGQPRTTLVRLGAGRSVGPLRLTFDAPGLEPGNVRPPSTPLTVVDLVPLGQGCPGHVCRIE